MRTTDYTLKDQAENYHNFRFAKGLEIVDLDEGKIITKWINSIKPRPKIILDVGSGTGRILKYLLQSGPNKIYALDQSKVMLGVLSKNYQKQIKSKTIEVLNTDSDKIPLKSKSLNLVTSFHLFKHLTKPLTTLNEMNRVLKSHGYLILDFLNTESVVKFNLDTCVSYNENEFRKILKKSGFKVIEIKYLHLFGETVYKISGNFLKLPIHLLDKFLSDIFRNSTKILVLAQKVK